MSDNSLSVGARIRQGWRRWLSAVLFALVAGCFALPFASTSCTLPGGYARGAAGTSTTYRGVDLAFDSVPIVTPSDRPPRPDSLPNDGQLGFQPLALLALLLVVAGIATALTRGAAAVVAHAAVAALVLTMAQLVAISTIAGQIGGTETLPVGKAQTDYIGTGLGFLGSLVGLVLLLALNGVAALWVASRRARAPLAAT